MTTQVHDHEAHEVDAEQESRDRKRNLEAFVRFAQGGAPRQNHEPYLPDPRAAAAFAILSAALRDRPFAWLPEEVFGGLLAVLGRAHAEPSTAASIASGTASAVMLAGASPEERERIEAFAAFVKRGQERDTQMNGQADMRQEAKVYRLAVVVATCLGRLSLDPDPLHLAAIRDFFELANRSYNKASALLMSGGSAV